jgi:sugar phosphate isomerase/epimerase
MAGASGMETVIEIGAGVLRNLGAASAAIRHVGRADFRLLVDTMHFFRSGSRAADLAALDSGCIGYVQLCDVPMVGRMSSYMEEALGERMVPGTGELPLFDILAVVPRDCVIGLEVPMLARALGGQGPYERLMPCVEAARALLAKVESVNMPQ